MSRTELTRLYELLACPLCHRALRPRDHGLGCRRCRRFYPVVDGIPVLLPPGAEALPPDPALPPRAGYHASIQRTVLDSLPADAVCLEIGAGRMAESRPNVIRMDVTLTPYVDVVGDVHALPFRSGRLDYVFALAVLEHLRDPFAAAREMGRVLRNGGYVYSECSFVFPFHGHPNHYFNASHLGMAELFHDFTSLRAGVGPHQMPSFALRALLETYLFFLSPHPDADSQRLTATIRTVLDEPLAEFDQRFSQEAALRCAACTYFFGVKAAEAGLVIPGPVLAACQRNPSLQERYPNPFDLSESDNLLTWARDGEGRREAAVAAHFDAVVPFVKNAPGRGPGRGGFASSIVSAVRQTASTTTRLMRRVAARAPGRRWSVEAIIDDGERVTHLFPNDCYVAHRSIYHFALPFAAGAAVLDAGCGAGYGAAYLADHGADAVAGVDASAKAVAFSRAHFARPNLRFDVLNIERLQQYDPGRWNVVVCSNVLEHVREVGRFLRGVWTLLDPRGVLVVAVPPIVNDDLRAQNLANPYHLNIWSPRQWRHALGQYFADVETFQHWYDKPGVELNLINSPADTVIEEGDFRFRSVPVEQLYELPTISAIFTARRPMPRDRLPTPSAPLGFVDDSFTRPPPAPAPGWWPRLRGALAS